MKTLFFDINAFSSKKLILEQGLKPLNDLMEAANALEFEAKIKTPAELRDLIQQGPETYYRERLKATLTPVKLGGVTVDPEKQLELLTWPDLRHIKELAADASNYSYHVDEYTFSNGKFSFGAKEIELLKESCTVYAKNKKQEKYIDAYTKLAEAIENFNKICTEAGSLTVHPDSPVSRYFTFNDGKVSPRDSHISQCLSGMQRELSKDLN